MVQVKTKLGIVEGIFDGDEEHLLFAGIPYAQPPVGELRFRPPQRMRPWQGVKKCGAFGPAAMQKVIAISPGKRWMCYGQEFFISGREGVSEDCLYLNLWLPAGGLERAEKLPVIVIIHGGKFNSGAGSVPVLNGRNLSSEGVIVVTVNYRLGIFGFLAHPELSRESEYQVSGNYGILDQIAALQWVQENIECFGGDPGCVTIAGESAGAGSVLALYQSPLAKGLFHRAFAQSCALFDVRVDMSRQREVNLANREREGEELLRRAGVYTAAEIRAMAAEKLMELTGEWSPIIDGYLLPGDYREVFENHSQNDVPLLLGSNSDEGVIFTKPHMDEPGLKQELQRLYGDKAKVVAELYFDGKTGMPHAWYHERRDRIFEHNMYVWSVLQSRYGKCPAYLYYFDRAVPEVGFGAFHSAALKYFYQNLTCTEAVWEAADYELSRRMTRYLLQFMRYGDPNAQGLERWLPFSESPDMTMELGEHVGMIHLPHKKMLEVLTDIYGL
ncbi:carboxylesterase/lipase family protein [Diplocloster hominis]|uniref:carboxylesterase/lipase family protein n=1 Tax=Diplocloster hominis TaxID=3079010 RepID=UPI0031BA5DBA